MKFRVIASTIAIALGMNIAPQGHPSLAAPNTKKPASASATARLAEPVCGRVWGSDQQGYGKVRPSTIFNGGDPSGIVKNIRWISWGKERAIGKGIGLYVRPNGDVASGHPAATQVVLWNLGKCHGQLAYRNIEWYFPQYREKFDPKNYIDMCDGNYIENGRK